MIRDPGAGDEGVERGGGIGMGAVEQGRNCAREPSAGGALVEQGEPFGAGNNLVRVAGDEGADELAEIAAAGLLGGKRDDRSAGIISAVLALALEGRGDPALLKEGQAFRARLSQPGADVEAVVGGGRLRGRRADRPRPR